MVRRPFESRTLATLSLAMLAAAGCSRSALDGGAFGAELGGAGGSNASTSSSGAGGDGGRPPVPCSPFAVGAPKSLITFDEGDADTPSLATLEPGLGPDDSGGPRPARFAVTAISEDAHFWHPELRLASLEVGAAWPEDVSLTSQLALVGVDAHAWGELAPSPDANAPLGLVWHRGDEAAGKPSGLTYRAIDPQGLAAGPEAFIDPLGTVTYRVAPGRSVNGGAFEGEGFGVTYRALDENNDAGPRVAVVDVDGTVVVDPVSPVPSFGDYPGYSSSIVWTGTSYLVATATASAVAVARVEPNGALVDTANLEPPPDAIPRAARLASHAGHTWLAWWTRPEDDEAAPQRLRAVPLSAEGDLVGSEVTLAEGAHPTTTLTFEAGAHGLLAMWGQAGDHDLPTSEPGYDQIIVVHRTLEAEPLVSPILVDVPELAYYRHARPVAELGHPRGYLLGWGAQSGPADAVFVLRLECAER